MNGTAYSSPRDSVIAMPATAVLGCFDGVHIGHRSLLREAVRRCALWGTRPLIVSFEEPPAFSFGNGGKLLTDTEERRALFAACGIADAVFLRFSEVRNLSAEIFLREILRGRYAVDSAVCGYNFTFGKDRSGTPETLRRFFGDRVCVCPPVAYEGTAVSSSRIRAALSEGNLRDANAMLGRPFSLSGIPEKGRGDGTALGTPTANIFPADGRAVPAAGVYVTEVLRHRDGTVFRAVTDAGLAPTMDTTGRYRLESHLFGFSGSLYGEPLTVRFLSRIRDEQRFSSPSALQSAIAADIAAATAFFAKRSDKESTL